MAEKQDTKALSDKDLKNIKKDLRTDTEALRLETRNMQSHMEYIHVSSKYIRFKKRNPGEVKDIELMKMGLSNMKAEMEYFETTKKYKKFLGKLSKKRKGFSIRVPKINLNPFNWKV